MPELRVRLHASPVTTSWLLTGYLVSGSLATPVAGGLGDRFGRRRVLLWVLAICFAGGVLAAASTSMPALLAGRALQGVAGATFPLALGILRDELPPAWVGPGISMVSAVLGVGGVLGIGLAGPIVGSLGLHALFWLPLMVVAGAFLGVVKVVPRSAAPVPGASIDWVGAVLLCGWLVCLLVAISQGSAWGWGSARQGLGFAAGAGLLRAWLAWERRQVHPLIDVALLSLAPVRGANAIAVLYGYGFFTVLLLIPQFVQAPRSAGYGFGVPIVTAGLFLLPSALAGVLSGPLATWTSRRAGAERTLQLGLLCSMTSFAGLAAAHGSPGLVIVWIALMGAGNGLCYSALSMVIVGAVAAARTSGATGMNIVSRNVGGALGTQVSTAVVAAASWPAERQFVVAFTLAAAAPLAALVFYGTHRRHR